MNDDSETSHLDIHSRGDRYATISHLLLSMQRLLSWITNSNSNSHGGGSDELQETTLIRVIDDNESVTGSNENLITEKNGVGYGSIKRQNGGSLLVDSESIRQERPRQSVSPTLNKAKPMVAFLSCFCMVVLGISIVRKSAQGNINWKEQSLSEIFYFDTLFKGVKKRPSQSTIERPPPTARSILLVLRADVTPENPSVHDMDRQLTSKGMEDAEGLGIYLQQHRIPEPDWIFVSPSERTAFTTELMRRHWASNAPVAFEDILYTLEFNDYFNFVAGLNDHFRRVMIVGHNPAILNTAKKTHEDPWDRRLSACGFMEIRWNDLWNWNQIRPFSGSSTMAIDPNNNFFFSSSPR